MPARKVETSASVKSTVSTPMTTPAASRAATAVVTPLTPSANAYGGIHTMAPGGAATAARYHSRVRGSYGVVSGGPAR